MVPEKLRDLDVQRYDGIAAAVANRQDSAKHLTKAEVEKLVEWKLKHGTFRPALMGLVQSNTAQAVEETTKKAYAVLSSTSSTSKRSQADVLGALKILVGLKGIGPATASLLLAVLHPAEIPFFSDELFRWCCWDSEMKKNEGAGWQRKIRYNLKEYEMILGGVEKLKSRLISTEGEAGARVRVADVEKVAWVLGKEMEDVSAGEDMDVSAGKGDAAKQAEESVEEEPQETKLNEAGGSETRAKPAPQKGTKRKAAPAKTAAEGTRKSARTRK
ncbi:hypothetical protein ACJQWK_03427 [Exserohilum turcicum]